MLRDKVKIRLKAGKGGDGALKFGKFKKNPVGGDGGRGGNIIVEGTLDREDLGFINPNDEFKAEDGQTGGEHNSRGRFGEDLVIKLPLITEIYDSEGKLLHVIDKVGEPHMLLKGGVGGYGNYYFRRGQLETLNVTTPGKPGQELEVTLIHKLFADVVFIGLPNAGKSSILNSLTNAHAKVGHYPFTTINPNLGSLPGMKLMDLPGLIEGTAHGKGLGPGFLKHTDRSKLVAHFISLESDDLMRDYTVIRKELEEISEDLANKKEILVLTKTDLYLPEEIEEKIKEVKKLNKEIILCSSYDDDTIPGLEEAFRKNIAE